MSEASFPGISPSAGRIAMACEEQEVVVYNVTKETFLGLRVKVADTVWGRLVGLLGKRSLHSDSGAWIVPANSIHTVGMLFPIDVVLIDKEFKVVGLREVVRPFSLTRPILKAESVIELAAHSIFKSRTEVGDQLLIERRKEQSAGPLGSDETAGDHNARVS
jgi:uncharacterized membrane protein (UPF0127 family)